MGPGDYEIGTQERDMDRRRFLQWGALGALSALMPVRGLAAIRDSLTPERPLSFYNTHTGENLHVVYWVRGKYLPAALAEINHILRDHRTGEIKAIDTRLLDLVYALKERFEDREPFHVISGYRSPKTNALLRANGRGVAENSLHLQGKAVDIRLPGCDLALLRREAIRLRGGGVGYYPGPGFIHIDVGRVRCW
jgi:uncharacterized protein YcbK (DUF882 family)